MLKKFLTTIIVLAATATAWADKWSVAYDENGCHDATITKSADGTKTLAEAIAEVNSKTKKEENGNLVYVQKVIIVAESMTEEEETALGAITQNHVDLSSAKGVDDFASLMNNENVKYVILPDGMTKEQVNAVGSGFDAAVSMGAHTKTVWRYDTYNTTGIEYTGVRYNETVVDGTAQATGKVSETVALSNPTTLYSGKVFYDKSGNAYQTSDDSKSVQLTAYTKRYTYNDNGTTRLYPNSSGYYVVSENGGYVGVQTSSTVTVEKKDVKYTYEKEDGKTYAYSFREYGKWDNYIGKKGEQFYMLEGGSFVDIQTETKWIIESTSEVYNEVNGRLVTDNNIGHVDGTKIPLTKVSAYYYDDNIYEGPIRIVGEKAYGRNGGTLVELSLVYYYEDWNDYNTVKPADKETFYVNYNGTKVATGNGFFEVTLNASGEYVDVNGNVQHGANETNVYKKLSGDGKMYMNWSNPAIYNVTSFGYEYPDGTTCTKVYTKDGKYYGYTDDDAEIELENRISYTTEGGEPYEGGVYTYNNEYFGYDGGESVNLKEETSEYYTQYGVTYPVTKENYKSEDGKKVYVGGTQTPLTIYNKEAYVITTTGELHKGRVYNETTGLIGGTETPVTYSAEGYYYNTDYIYTGEYVTKKVYDYDNVYGCTDVSELIQLTAVYRYTYKDPITGDDNVVYETMEQESSVTVTHDVTVTAYEESAGNVHLTAYVSAPGSLKFALARWKELGNNNAYAAQVGNVTALTLSGDVNYADIGTNGGDKRISKYGHVQYYNSDTNTDVIPDGTVPESEKDNTTYYKDPDVQGHPNTIENNFAAMDGNTLTYIDLTDAVFAVQTDMMFANVSEKFGTILLPTSPEMTLIPANSFKNLYQGGLTEICIPYNYEEIGDEAFYNTSITHFYTTDAAGNTITNGPNTMTFSENLRIIKTSNYHVTFSGAGANTITDVYVMRFVEGAEPNDEDPLNFPTTQCQPNAFQASMTCGNSGNAGDQAHPISRKNFQNQSMWMSILHYPQSTDGTIYENMYTDLTRVYTLNDETGYVDGSGRPFKWPKHGEFVQASNSVKAENGKEPSHFDGTPYDADFLAKHRGWIEFVLVGKSNNQDIDVQSEIEFVQRDWYTLCVPYDLTKSNLLELFGIDDPEETTDTELVTMLGETEAQEVEGPMYPDVRVITEVSRSLNNAKVTFHLSKPLLNNADGNDYGVVIPEEGPNQGQGYEYVTLDGDDPVIIEGGHPFLVRGFVPKAWDPDIKNMGMYVMAIAASVNSAATIAGVAEEELPYQMSDKCLVNGVSLPCVKHHIHARNADEEGEYVYEDKNKTIPACYHFIGTYTETTVPQYAYYLGKNKNTKKHQFFRTTKETTKWNPYSAVIIGLNDPGYNDGDFTTGTSLQNIVVKWNTPKSDLVILEGEDPARAGQALSLIFDEGVADDTTTGITDVDVNVNVSNNKVYSINGQYMGTSLNKLPKGIYIINGQKKVVK